MLFQLYNAEQITGGYDVARQYVFGIFYCRKGKATVLLDGHVYHVERGFLCVCAPYMSLKMLQYDDDIDAFLLLTQIDTLYAALSNIPVQDRIILREHPCIRLTPSQCEQMEQLTEILVHRNRLLKEEGDRTQAKFMRLLVQILMHALCIEVIGFYFEGVQVEEVPQSGTDKIFSQFFLALNENCVKERTVMFYANQLHLSPNYLSSIIKAKTGRTALQVIISASIIRAQHYLDSTKLSIKEIAEEMNFPDPSTFGRFFKKYCGVSPLRYRNRDIMKSS